MVFGKFLTTKQEKKFSPGHVQLLDVILNTYYCRKLVGEYTEGYSDVSSEDTSGVVDEGMCTCGGVWDISEGMKLLLSENFMYVFLSNLHYDNMQ